MYFVLTRVSGNRTLCYRTRHGDLTQNLWEAQVFKFEVRDGRAIIVPFLPDGGWDITQVNYEVVKPPKVVHVEVGPDDGQLEVYQNQQESN